MNVEYGKIAEVAFSGDTSANKFASVRFEQIDVNIPKIIEVKKQNFVNAKIPQANIQSVRTELVSNSNSAANIKLEGNHNSSKKELKNNLDIMSVEIKSNFKRAIENKDNTSKGALTPNEVSSARQSYWNYAEKMEKIENSRLASAIKDIADKFSIDNIIMPSINFGFSRLV